MRRVDSESAVSVRPVRSVLDRRRFLTFAWKIYRDDPLWVPPLIPQRRAAIDHRRGAFFKRGEAELYIAYRGGSVVGTICAAVDWEQIRAMGRRECVFGFFECVNDHEVCSSLFAAAERFASRHELETLVGPFHLDYEDGYGILVSGRDRPPVILCGHTPPYYQRLLERLGFEPARPANVAFAVEIEDPPAELLRIGRVAELARTRGHYRVRGADFDHLEVEVDRIHELLNRSLARIPEESLPWPREAVEALVAPFKKIADPELILFVDAIHGRDAGRTVGWFPGIPNINEILKHVNGLRYPWDYLRLAVHLSDTPSCLAAKSLLVLPEHQRSGAAALLFDELRTRAKRKGYRWIDLSLTSSANPQTPILARRAGAYEYKRYQVYHRRICTDPTVRVVAAIAERRGALLIAKRSVHTPRGGSWEFPGGKVEAGESDTDALRRELAEELGVKAEIGERLESVVWSYPDMRIELIPMRVTLGGDPQARNDHSELRWIAPDSLPSVDLAPADRQIVRLCLRLPDSNTGV